MWGCHLDRAWDFEAESQITGEFFLRALGRYKSFIHLRLLRIFFLPLLVLPNLALQPANRQLQQLYLPFALNHLLLQKALITFQIVVTRGHNFQFRLELAGLLLRSHRRLVHACYLCFEAKDNLIFQ